MTDKKSNDSRRKLLKSIAAGSGAVVAGKSLPDADLCIFCQRLGKPDPSVEVESSRSCIGRQTGAFDEAGLWPRGESVAEHFPGFGEGPGGQGQGGGENRRLIGRRLQVEDHDARHHPWNRPKRPRGHVEDQSSIRPRSPLQGPWFPGLGEV